MNNTEFILDDKPFMAFLDSMKTTKFKQSLNSGARKSLQIVKKQGIENLKTLVKWKNGRSVNVDKEVVFKKYSGGKRNNYKVDSFKKTFKIKTKRGTLESRVEIIHNKSGYNPLLTMMESSKGERYTKGSFKLFKKSKLPHSTGSIGRRFFSKAIQQTQTQVYKDLQSNIHNAIIRAKNKAEHGK